MILDQPIEEQPKVFIKRWSWWEKIVPPFLLVTVIFRELTGSLWSYEVIELLGGFLCLSYLFAYYWIDKPSTRSFRTVFISILYGFSFLFAMVSFLLLILFYPGGRYCTYFTVIAIGITIILDMASSGRKTIVLNKITITRIAIFAAILTTFNLIPEQKHVQFIYRSYPGFIAYYNEHFQEGLFPQIFDEYRKVNNIPMGELK